MKSWITTCLLFTMTCSLAVGQGDSPADTTNQVDGQGRKQGYWSKPYTHGVKRYEGYFKDDQPVGLFKYYYEDGKLQTTMKHVNGQPGLAFAKHYHQQNGNLMAEGFYRGQDKDSTWSVFTLDGKKVATESYKQGKKHGLWENFYLDGKVAESKHFADNLEQGAYKRYFPDGALKYDANYVDGNPDGTVKSFFPNGLVKSVGKYNSAVKHGKWTYYGVDGKVRVEEEWVRGDLKSQIVDGVAVEPGASMYDRPDTTLVKEKVISQEELNEIKDEWGE